jgi:hypothetical protein
MGYAAKSHKMERVYSWLNMHCAAGFARVVSRSFAMHTAAAIFGGRGHSQKHSGALF